MNHDGSSSNPDADGLPDELGDRARDETTRREYEALWKLLRRTDEATDAAFSTDAAWNDLAADLPMEAAGADRGSKADPSSERPGPAPDRPARATDRRRTQWRRRWVSALVAVVLVVAGATLWWSRPAAVQTAAGEQTTVTLPDGSTAELNGATTVRYARGFSVLPGIDASMRRVELRGEAFFTVLPSDRPFQVKTPNAVVEVLGTAFVVRARTEGEAPVTDVTLSSGRVRLRSLAGVAGDTTEAHRPVVLATPGQYSRVAGFETEPTAPHKDDLQYATAWREGGFAARNASLPAILRDLEAQFGTSIRLRVPAPETDAMTLHYGDGIELEDILRDIAAVQGLRYRAMNRGYELVRPDSAS